MTKHISIIGAGVAGLVLGQCLRQRQIPAIIWEKSKNYKSLQNFGITLQPKAYLPLLRALNIDESTFIEEAVIKPLSGVHTPRDDQVVRVNRSTFLGLLAENLDIRWSHKLDSIATESEHKHLKFTDEHGTIVEHESDVVIAADGVHSAVRNALNLSVEEFELKVLPFIVYNGKRTFPAADMPAGLEQCLTDPRGITLAKEGYVLKISSGYHDQKKKQVAINYTLSRPATPKDDDMLKRGKSDAETLAKKIMDEAHLLNNLPEPFKTVFDPQRMKEDRLLHWLMRSAVPDVNVLKKQADKQLLVFGDAANPTPILGGGGANYAILSALQIADMLSSDAAMDTAVLDELHKSWTTWRAESEQNLREMHHGAAAKAAI